MKRLLDYAQKDNSKVLLGNLTASFFGLLNFMMLVRMTSKTDFGNIVIFLSMAGLADLVRTGFVRQGLVRHWISDENQNKKSLIGSAWILHLAVAVVIWMLCESVTSVSALFSFDISNIGLLLSYYPLMLLVSIPHQMESWVAQSKKHYSAMNAFRLGVNLIFTIMLALEYKAGLSADEVMMYMILSNAVVSLFSLFFYSSIKELVHAKYDEVVSLFHFGKYSLSTLAGSNLLKSTDILLIGMIMNAESAAIYALPFKVIELLEIPLRGFVMTSFNTLTELFQENNPQEYAKVFKKNIIRLTVSFSPIIAVCLLVPSLVIGLLGGSEYHESFFILQVVAFAMILLPMDKFIGMALDSINEPARNAQKVWIMVGVNLLGDLLVMAFDGPLWMIAVVTVLNILLGIAFGLLRNSFLNRTSGIQLTALRQL